MEQFLLGVIFAGLAGWYFYAASRREVFKLVEDKQYLEEEKQIVLEFTHNMVEAIGEGVDREELYKRVVHAAIISTGALSACLFEKVEDDRIRGVAVEGLFPPHRPLPASSKVKLTTRARFIEQILRSETFDIGEGVVGEVARTRKGLIIRNAQEDDRIIRHDDQALIVRSIIVVPVAFRDKILGVLSVCNPADGLPFTDTDYSLVESLGEQAALAIHNMDLVNLQIEQSKIETDLALAQNIQGMLLPGKYPEIPGLNMDAIYLPAQKVGGDLYDLFQLDDNRVGIAIADVSGKGIPASLLMAICQCNMRHFAKLHDSPAKVLSELNRVMIPEMRQDMFVTMIFGIVDRAQNKITFARAGHELPLLYRVNESSGIRCADMVGSEGMAVGMVEDSLFEMIIQDREIKFHKGDIFVLYTDGVTEAVNEEGTEYSSSRLADVINTQHDRNAHDLNRGILESLKRFSGNTDQGDDITLVAVKHT